METEQSAVVLPTGAVGSDCVPGSRDGSIGSSSELCKSSAEGTDRDPCALVPTLKDAETITLTPSSSSRERVADNSIPRKRKRVQIRSPVVEASSTEAKQHTEGDKICWAPTAGTANSDGSDDDDPHLHSPIIDDVPEAEPDDIYSEEYSCGS